MRSPRCKFCNTIYYIQREGEREREREREKAGGGGPNDGLLHRRGARRERERELEHREQSVGRFSTGKGKRTFDNRSRSSFKSLNL